MGRYLQQTFPILAVVDNLHRYTTGECLLTLRALGLHTGFSIITGKTARDGTSDTLLLGGVDKHHLVTKCDHTA